MLELPRFLGSPAIRLMETLRRTEAARLLPDLLESESWPLGRLEELQTRRLGELGEFCLEEVPYYGDFLGSDGPLEGQLLDPQNLTKFPLMTKDIIRQEGLNLRSRSFQTWQPRAKSTSGSTGQPLNYFLDRNSHSYQWGHLWRGWHQVGYRPGDLYATLSGGSLLPEKVDFKQKVYLALSSALHFPSYHLTDEIMESYLATLCRKSIPFLYGYPSSVELFADYILSGSNRALPMKAVFTTSESLKPSSRKTIEKAFGCKVIDTYGCNDGGLYSFECKHQSGFHVGMESVFVEITDDQGLRLPDGEIGNIVTTNLAMRAMPLLRYMTGDMGALNRQPCACGRGLQRIVDLQGRERDFVLTPGGRKVHGAFFNHFEPFYDALWLKQFQVYQPDQATLIVRLVVHRAPQAGELAQLEQELKKGLGAMDFRLEIVDKVELTRTGKFRIIVSDIT